ncbi:hypothetical protein EB796_003850 [Bugula neritina]|uniref:Uncharacterized protein n=1 Tax=Bugula neritina TaxID=10212 RepID=A0A7J7KHX9_BUGNE|nr:hypothetical protein EB796_003850 [Bugula neritina]
MVMYTQHTLSFLAPPAVVCSTKYSVWETSRKHVLALESNCEVGSKYTSLELCLHPSLWVELWDPGRPAY